MGYNASIYTKQPVQFIAFVKEGNSHTFLRDKYPRPCRPDGWSKINLNDGLYFAEAHYRHSTGAQLTNFVVAYAQKFPEEEFGKIERVNSQLYPLMLARTHLGLSLADDYLHLTLQAEIRGSDDYLTLTCIEAAKEKAKQEQARCSEQYQNTGIQPPELDFWVTQATTDLDELFDTHRTILPTHVPEHLKYLLGK